jgi:hypothetical protein
MEQCVMIHHLNSISFPITEPHALDQDEAYCILKENSRQWK